MPRIVSFLPAGTEIAWAIGAGPDLVGRSHECDYPDPAGRLPVVSRPALALEGMSGAEMDRAVAARLATGESLYQVDEVLLRHLEPEVILTQNLCQVCAPSGNELSRALKDLPGNPQVVWLSPRTLADIDENILAVGEAAGRREAAMRLVEENHARIGRVEAALVGAPVRRVAFLEWVDPPYAAGHWVPEMIARAGGNDPLGRTGRDSVRVRMEDVEAGHPEIVVVAPCGYRLEPAIDLAQALPGFPGARVVAVDANAYFARPGPRMAEGIELLAHLFHPGRVPWTGPGQPWQEVG
jgi:iron complex transport system substrate-binding protein